MSFPAFPRARRLAVVPAVVLLTLIAAPGAHAGSYQVRACDPSTINRSWTPYGDTGLVAADASCLADGVRGMKVRNSLRSPGGAPVLAGSGVTGGLQAVAPAGTAITGLHADATAYDEKGSSGIDGWRAGIRVDGRTDVWCAFQHMCSWIGPPTLRIDLAAQRVERAAGGDLRAQHRLPAGPRPRGDDPAQHHARRARRRRAAGRGVRGRPLVGRDATCTAPPR